MLLMYTVSPEKVKVPLTPNFKNVSVSLETFRFEGKYTVFLGVFFSCKQNITQADMVNLNGYWEIEKVVLPDGDKKEYKIKRLSQILFSE